MVLAVALAAVFGPVGLLYTCVWAGMLMLVLAGIALATIGWWAIPAVWPVCILLAALKMRLDIVERPRGS